ncbi:MAG: hypothetical protein V3T95_02090, partial [Acidobacteriota bacterium]
MVGNLENGGLQPGRIDLPQMPFHRRLDIPRCQQGYPPAGKSKHQGPQVFALKTDAGRSGRWMQDVQTAPPQVESISPGDLSDRDSKFFGFPRQVGAQTRIGFGQPQFSNPEILHYRAQAGPVIPVWVGEGHDVD